MAAGESVLDLHGGPDRVM